MLKWLAVTVVMSVLLVGQPVFAGEAGNAKSIAEIQDGLSTLGYYRSKIDGAWGEGTEAAVAMFVADERIPYRAAVANSNDLLRRAITAAIERLRSDPNRIFVPGPTPVSSSDSYLVSADGKIAVTIGQSSVIVWDVRAGRAVRDIVTQCCVATGDLSSDGQLLALVSADGVRIWNIPENRVVTAFALAKGPNGNDRTATIMRFTPSNKFILIGDRSGTVTIHGLDGRTRIVGNHISPKIDASIYGAITGLAVSPDGTMAATLAPFDGAVKIWDIAKGRLIREVPLFPQNVDGDVEGGLDDSNDAAALAFDGSGNSVVLVYSPLIGWEGSFRSGGEDIARVQSIDVKSGKIRTLDIEPKSFAIDVMGRHLAVSTYEETVHLIDLTTLGTVRSMPSPHLVKAIDSLGAAMLALMPAPSDFDDNQLGFLDLETGAINAAPANQRRNITTLAIDGAMNRVIAGVFDDHLASVSLDDGVVAFQPLEPSRNAEEDDLDWSQILLVPSGALVDWSAATVPVPGEDEPGEKRVLSVDSATGKTLVIPVAPGGMEDGYARVSGPVPSSDGAVTATTFEQPDGDGDAQALVSIVDTASGEEIARHAFFPQTDGPVGANCVFFNWPCHRSVFTSDEMQRQWLGVAAGVALSGTGKYALAAYWEPALSAINIETGEIERVFDTALKYQDFGDFKKVGPGMGSKGGWDTEVVEAGARGASVPKSILPVPGSDDFIVVLASDFGSRSYMQRFSFGQSTPSASVQIPMAPDIGAISPDGTKVAFGYDGGLILLLDASTGQTLAELTGSDGYVGTLAFSADGTRLYSTTGARFVQHKPDGALRTWDATTGDLLASTYIFENQEWLTMTPEGFYSASAGGSAILTVRTGPVSSGDAPPQAMNRPELVKAKLAGDPAGLVAAAFGHLRGGGAPAQPVE